MIHGAGLASMLLYRGCARIESCFGLGVDHGGFFFPDLEDISDVRGISGDHGFEVHHAHTCEDGGALGFNPEGRGEICTGLIDTVEHLLVLGLVFLYLDIPANELAGEASILATAADCF